MVQTFTYTQHGIMACLAFEMTILALEAQETSIICRNCLSSVLEHIL